MPKIVLYGIQIDSVNRGVSALTYGHIEMLKNDYEFDTIYSVRTGKGNKQKETTVKIDNKPIKFVEIKFDWKLFLMAIFLVPFAKLFKNYSINPVLDFFKDVDLVCAANGGDSFADIYGLKRIFLEFITILVSEFMGIKVIFTPQTIGPFKTLLGKIMGAIPLILADKIFVRDEKGESFLSAIHRTSIKSRDVSSYMQPQKVEYTIQPNTIGFNINGLMWENTYEGLANCFDNYKKLLKSLTDTLLEKGYNILFVPHTYSINEKFNENDYKAIVEFIEQYKDNKKISFLKEEYTAPELKYIISKTEFFIGSRMHSNLAALTTSTPTLALSYSYKFDGTFEMFGVEENVINAKNISQDEIPKIIEKALDIINNRENTRLKLRKINSENKAVRFV